jgi:DNA invertase Pin-like site-specific DNA recombinase
MKIGYARVSTSDQELASQIDALKAAGVDERNIYTDKKSGKNKSRPGLESCLKVLREGDELVFTRLSRLCRSLKDLLAITEDLQERGVALRAIHQDFDITSANGKLVMQILGAVDEFQRNIIADNTREGLESAKARGRVGGRPAGLDARRVKTAQQLKAQGATIVDIARTLKVSRATVYRHLEAAEAQQGRSPR